VRPVSFIETVINENCNRIILPHATWETFIVRRANIEQLLQSPVSSSLLIRDLDIELKMRRKNARHTYCKIEIMRCLLVHEMVKLQKRGATSDDLELGIYC